MKPASLPLRSFPFAPGNHARRVANALSLDADAVILDLEDAVATAEKPAARGAVSAVLTLARQSLLYVRVNAADTEFCYGALVAVSTGFCVACPQLCSGWRLPNGLLLAISHTVDCLRPPCQWPTLPSRTAYQQVSWRQW